MSQNPCIIDSQCQEQPHNKVPITVNHIVTVFAVVIVNIHWVKFYFYERLTSINSFGDDKCKDESERISVHTERIKGSMPQLCSFRVGSQQRWLTSPSVFSS